jgi:hypothetical protein
LVGPFRIKNQVIDRNLTDINKSRITALRALPYTVFGRFQYMHIQYWSEFDCLTHDPEMMLKRHVVCLAVTDLGILARLCVLALGMLKPDRQWYFVDYSGAAT